MRPEDIAWSPESLGRTGGEDDVRVRWLGTAGFALEHRGHELVEQSVQVKHVDLLLMCVAGWTSSPRLPERVAHSLAPAAILLSHWDDFLRPLDRPLRALPAMRLPQLVERLGFAAPSVRMGTLPALGEVWI